MEEKIKLNFNEEQTQDFKLSYWQKVKEWIRRVLDPKGEKPLHGKELDDYLVSQGKSEEEKELIADMSAEIDTFHQKRREFETSGKDIETWYDEELERLTKEVDPNATSKDVDAVKEAIAEKVDEEISESADELEEYGKIMNSEKSMED